MVCITYTKFVAQLSKLKVAETYIKAIEIIKLNECMRMLEELMDQWPFLINDMLLVAILMMYGSGRSGWHCGPITMIRYGLCHLYEVCCSTVQTEGGRNIHKVN